jgi:O-antigen/teichoic acid export membrane protein
MSDADEPNTQAESDDARTVAHSLSWTLLGELGFAAGQWLALVALAKLATPEALGRYSLGLAVATPVIVLCNLHLRPVWVVDVEGRTRFEHVFALRLLALPLALAITAGVVLVRGWGFETAAVIMLLGVVRAAGSLSDICYARAQRAEHMDTIGISRLTRGVLWLGALCLGLVLGDELLAVGLVAAVLVLHTLVYDLPAARRHGELRPRFDGPQLRRVLVLALPMGLAGGVLGVSANVPAYVLEAEADLAAVGFFAAVLSIQQASGVLNMALGNAAIPRLAKLAHGDARGFWRLLLRLLGLVALLNGVGVALVVVFGELYLRLAFEPQYAEYLPELIVASLAALVVGLANMLSQTLTSLSQFRLQLGLNLLALVFSGVSAWLLIGAWGLRGAIWSLVALAGFRFVIYVAAVAWAGPRGD